MAKAETVDRRSSIQKKKEAVGSIWALENPFEKTSKMGTTAHYIYEASKVWGIGLVITDPLGIMTEPGPENISFIYTPSSWVEPTVMEAPISTGAEIGGGPTFGSFLDFSGLLTYDFSNIEFNYTPEESIALFNFYRTALRNSQWPAWN